MRLASPEARGIKTRCPGMKRKLPGCVCGGGGGRCCSKLQTSYPEKPAEAGGSGQKALHHPAAVCRALPG